MRHRRMLLRSCGPPPPPSLPLEERVFYWSAAPCRRDKKTRGNVRDGVSTYLCIRNHESRFTCLRPLPLQRLEPDSLGLRGFFAEPLLLIGLVLLIVAVEEHDLRIA